MGRYYSGDINGKFWFGVQSSDDASFFGGEQREPNYIEYYFDGSHKPAIAEGLRQCHVALGGYEAKLAAAFAGRQFTTDDHLSEALGITKETLDELLVWYARLELGQKIWDCVLAKGDCAFDADYG